MTPPAQNLHEFVVRFSDGLQLEGGRVSIARVLALKDALALFELPTPVELYWCGRATLCGSSDDLGRFDRHFVRFIAGRVDQRMPLSLPIEVPSSAPVERGRQGGPQGGDSEAAKQEAGDDPVVAQNDKTFPADAKSREAIAELTIASYQERLRHADIADISAPELMEVAAWLARYRFSPMTRISRRSKPSSRGAIDRERTVKSALRYGGEPGRLYRRLTARKARRYVVLLDVSGSMKGYATALLNVAHAILRGGRVTTEVFTIGTRLTRITKSMRLRIPFDAIRSAAATVPDWQGGTRLGEQLKIFLDQWGQRGMARGAAFLIVSDGWESGDASLLAEQMLRLSRLTHRVVWCNPHKSTAGYQPIAKGIAAALPFIDKFMPGRTPDELEELLDAIQR